MMADNKSAKQCAARLTTTPSCIDRRNQRLRIRNSAPSATAARIGKVTSEAHNQGPRNSAVAAPIANPTVAKSASATGQNWFSQGSSQAG